MKKIYKVNGKKFGTLLEVAKELGKSRVYEKDFEKYGITVEDEKEKVKKSSKISASKSKKVGSILVSTLKSVTLQESKPVFKAASIEELLEAVNQLGLNSWENMKDSRIRRMRVIMELKSKFF